MFVKKKVWEIPEKFSPEKVQSRKSSVQKKFSPEEVQSRISLVQRSSVYKEFSSERVQPREDSVPKKFSTEEVQSRIPQEKVNSKYLPHNVWYCCGGRTYSDTYPDLYQNLLIVFSCCIFQHIASYGVRNRVRARARVQSHSSES